MLFYFYYFYIFSNEREGADFLILGTLYSRKPNRAHRDDGDQMGDGDEGLLLEAEPRLFPFVVVSLCLALPGLWVFQACFPSGTSSVGLSCL